MVCGVGAITDQEDSSSGIAGIYVVDLIGVLSREHSRPSLSVCLSNRNKQQQKERMPGYEVKRPSNQLTRATGAAESGQPQLTTSHQPVVCHPPQKRKSAGEAQVEIGTSTSSSSTRMTDTDINSTEAPALPGGHNIPRRLILSLVLIAERR